MRILLRKIHGVFGATIGQTARPAGYTAARAHAAPGAGALFAIVCAVAFVALLLLVALFSSHAATGVALAIAPVAATKELVDEIKAAFEQFKSKNDERISAIEKKGFAPAETVQDVEKANTAITAATAKLTELEKQVRDVETAQARVIDSGANKLSDAQRDDVRAYLAFARKQPVASITTVTDDDVKAFRAYGAAFDTYCRVGERGMSADMMAALQTGSDPNGGFMITPDRAGRMVKFITDESPIREYASVETIGTDTLEGQLDMDEDVTSGWVGETESRTETSTPRGPGEWKIPVFEQYAAPKATQKQLDDADRDVGAWLEAKMGRRYGRQEQAAFHSGSGVKQPRGFLTYASVGNKPAAANVASWQRIEAIKSGANGAFAGSNPGDKLIDLINALHPNYRGNANFFMPRLTVAEVRKLKDGQGNYLWQPSFNERTGASLLGYGIVEDEGMPAIANSAFGIAFGDMKSAYQIVDHKVGIRVLRDPFTQKPWVIFYGTKRVGGDVIDFQAIKLFQFAA